MNASCSSNLSVCSNHHFSTNGEASPPPIGTHTTHDPSICFDEGLRCTMSATLSLHSGNFNPCQLPWYQINPSHTHLHKLTDVTFVKRFKTDCLLICCLFFSFAFLHFSHVSIDINAHLSACSGLLKALNSAYKTLLEANQCKKLLMEDYTKKFKSGRGGRRERVKFVSLINNFCFYCFHRLMFGIFFLLNLVLWGEGSSAAVPFTTLLALLSMW